MNVLSLFDGMSCAQISLKELNILVGTYYASEIDKHAIAQTQLNFPDTIQIGSVVDVDISTLKPIDIIFAGSPCQSFSFAGKRKGMSTTCEIQITKLNQYLELKQQGFQFEGQSYLFWEFIRILTDVRKYNPGVLFLLENVEMGKRWERVLSEAVGIYGVHINSALVSAQNRKRIYWTNFSIKQVGLFGELHSDIQQPEDRGILLRDILESEVDEKYFLSEKALDYLARPKKDNNFNNDGFKMNENDDKSLCITAVLAKGVPYNQIEVMCVAMRGGNPENPSDRTTGSPTEQRLEPNYSGKTNCITSVQKDNLIITENYIQWDGSGFDQDNRAYFEDGKSGTLDIKSQRQKVLTTTKDNLVVQLNPSTESGGKQPYQQNRVYDINGIAPCLDTDSGRKNVLTESRIRRV